MPVRQAALESANVLACRIGAGGYFCRSRDARTYKTYKKGRVCNGRCVVRSPIIREGT
jgi:hypothetical protein